MDDTKKAEDKDVESTQDVLKKWNDYYINNNFGIGIQCDKCKKWREVYQYEDQSEVPEVWICSMWKMEGNRRGSCRIPSNLNEDNFALALYSPGALVWAKCPGYPWWPAMVEDCPDVQHYFMPYVDSEHEYHVNFFGKKPLRNWIKASCIKDFSTPPPMTPKAKKSKDLQRSIEQANEALEISPKERLKKYSFAVRYKGRWAKVKQLDKVNLPPDCLKRKKKEESTDSALQLVAEEAHANRNCDRTSTVKKARKGKSEIRTERRSVGNERSQSAEPKKNEISPDSEKEDSSEFRSQLKAEVLHVNQICHGKSAIRNLENVKSKSKAATSRMTLEEGEFKPVLQTVGAIDESSSDSEKEENGEEDSTKFRSHMKAKALPVKQDCHHKSAIRRLENVKSKSKAATNRNSVMEEEFQPVPQSVEAINESSSDSKNGEEDSSTQELKAEAPHANQGCHRKSIVRKPKNVKSKSKAASKRKSVDDEEFQPSFQSARALNESDLKNEENGEEDSSEFRPQLRAEALHVNQDCHRNSTVRKLKTVKSKAVSNRKPRMEEEFQLVPQSVGAISKSSSDSEKEENSSKFRSQVKTKEPRFQKDYPRALTVWEIRNAKLKSKTVTNRKSVDEEKFLPVQQSAGTTNEVCPRKLTVWELRNAKSKTAANQISVDKKGFQKVFQSVKVVSESSSDSEKEETSEEENSSEFGSQVTAQEEHLNQDCHSTLTVWEVRNAKSLPEDVTKRKYVCNEEFQPSGKHRENEFPDEDENSELEDFSEIRSPVIAESIACPDGPCVSTVRVVVGKSEDTNGRSIVEYEGYQSVQYKRSKCSTDSENESETDSPILNNNTTLSDSEEEEFPEAKTHAEYWKKKYKPSFFHPVSNLSSVSGSGGNCSYRNSDSPIHCKQGDSFLGIGSIICRENAAEFLENDTVNHNGNDVENSQDDSGGNILDMDASLLRIQYPYSSIAKYEQFSDRSERIKKNRERIRSLVDSNNSKYMPYSFYRGRMKK